MIRKLFSIIICLGFIYESGSAQSFISTSDLFKRPDTNSKTGKLNIIQDPAIDTLIGRYIMANQNLYNEKHYYGMEGWRIQIYSSSNRNAREEANKVRAEFISKFPDTFSDILYAEPGYFKVRVGNFRTKAEATKLFLIISKSFPDAYLVPDFISFPDLNQK